MKRALFVGIGLLMFVVFSAEISSAQLLKGNRRGGQQATAAAQGAYDRTKAAVQQAASTTQNPINQVTQQASDLASNLKVMNKFEEAYDINNDGILESQEIKSFLKEVSSAVDKKGSFSITSDILKPYDKDKNGIISKDEIAAIELATR